MSFKLESSDGLLFVLEDDVGLVSNFIARSLETLRGSNGELASTSTPVISVGKIHSATLELVLEWMKKDEDLNNCDLSSLHEIMKAANSLEIPELFSWSCKKISDILNEPKEVGTALATQMLRDLSMVAEPVVARHEVVEEGENQNVDEVVVPLFPADMLVEGVWQDIFSTLDYPDMLSCFRARVRWRNYMLSKRTLLLFPEVLELIKDYLPFNSFLELRVTCKKWRNDVDNASFSPSCITKFRSTQTIHEFLEAVASYSYNDNPFPQRCIELNFDCDERGQDENSDDYFIRIGESLHWFWSNVMELLDKFGQQIWSLTIATARSPYGFCFEGSFRLCLFRLPQLQCLTLVNGNCSFLTVGTVCPFFAREFFASNPLPRLPHLREFTSCELSCLMDDVLEYCCVPDVVRKLDTMEDRTAIQNVHSFVNLQVLKAWIKVEDLERFRNIEPPKLTSISLFLECMVNFERAISHLEVFAGTLTNLELEGEYYQDLMNPTFRMRFPKLTRLVLNEYEGTLEFLYELSALRHLEVINRHTETSSLFAGKVSENDEQFRNHVYGDAIWEHIPTLNVFSYVFATYKFQHFDFVGKVHRKQVQRFNELKNCVCVSFCECFPIFTIILG